MNKKTVKTEADQDRIIYLANRFDIKVYLLLDAIIELGMEDKISKKDWRSTLRYCREKTDEMHDLFSEVRQLAEADADDEVSDDEE